MQRDMATSAIPKGIGEAEYEKICDFLHKISMTLHGTLRTDIQFFQIRDFNAVIHYAPAKLRAFYSLWALELSNYYSLFCKKDNENEKTYSFVLTPGMFSEVGVEQLFDDDEEQHRLMLITLPERQLYTLQKTSIMLGHEVSHFVGTDVKCRRKRYFSLMNIIARFLTLEINHLRYTSSCQKNHRNELSIELEKLIAESRLYDRLSELLLERNSYFEQNYGLPEVFHSEKTISYLQRIVDSFINDYIDMAVAENCEYYYQNYKKEHISEDDRYEDRKKVIEIAESISYDRDEELKDIIRRFSGVLDSFLGRILYKILRESCADVSSILTLELKPMEYLLSFCNTGTPDKGRENAKNILSEKEIRISLVMTSIQREIAGYKNCFDNKEVFEQWKLFRIDKFVAKCTPGSELEVLGCKVFLYLDDKKDKNTSIRQYKSAYNNERGYFTGEVLDFYNDSVIWKEMNQYVSSCANEYLRQLSAQNSFQDQKNYLAKTYKSIAEESVSVQIQTIENFLHRCEEKFQNQDSDG